MIKKNKIFKICYFTKLHPIQEDEELYDNKQMDEDFKFINKDTFPLNSSNSSNDDETSCFDCFKLLCCFKSCCCY